MYREENAGMSPASRQVDWLSPLVAALATWRLAWLFMYEDGPFELIRSIRAWFGVRHDDYGTPIAWPDGSVFACFLCFSFWTGIAVSLLPSWLLRPLSYSTAAILISKWYSRG